TRASAAPASAGRSPRRSRRSAIPRSLRIFLLPRTSASSRTRTSPRRFSESRAWSSIASSGQARAFNSLTLASEVVGQLEVYKSPQADIEEGGVGATINVHTRNPLDLDPLTFSASAQMVYSERAEKWTPQPSGLVSWKNANETFGVLLGAVYQKRDIRRDGVEVLTYFSDPAIAGGAAIPGPIGSPTLHTGA